MGAFMPVEKARLRPSRERTLEGEKRTLRQPEETPLGSLSGGQRVTRLPKRMTGTGVKEESIYCLTRGDKRRKSIAWRNSCGMALPGAIPAEWLCLAQFLRELLGAWLYRAQFLRNC